MGRKSNKCNDPITTVKKLLTNVIVTLALAAITTMAQQAPAYGEPINLAQAKEVLAGAQAKARENDWNVVVAIVDAGGHLVLLERMDSTQYGSVEVALVKARSASAFRRPSKVFQDVVASGGAGLRILNLPAGAPFNGGLPLIVNGKLVGAIGVSGVTGEQDGIIAQAGVEALK